MRLKTRNGAADVCIRGGKERFENLTGLAQPTARDLKKRIKRSKPRAKRFDDNNLIPNNPALPLIHYRKVVSLTNPMRLSAKLWKGLSLRGTKALSEFLAMRPRKLSANPFQFSFQPIAKTKNP